MKLFEISQMRVSGDDEIGLSFQSAGQELIIGRIVGDFIGDIEIFGDQRLSEDQPKEPFDGFFFEARSKIRWKKYGQACWKNGS